MRIVCPNCSTGFMVRPELLGENGRTVRCANCGTKWFAAPVDEGTADPVSKPAQDVLPAQRERVEPEPAPAPPGTADVIEASTVPKPPDPRSVEAAARRPTKKKAVAKKQRKSDSRRSFGSAFAADAAWLVLVGTVVVVGLMAIFRTEVVRAMPATASVFAALGLPVNLRGMEIRDVAARIEFDNGQPQVVVEGTIQNLTDTPLAVPRLRFAIIDGGGGEINSWSGAAARPTIAPRESLPFRSRLTTALPAGNDIEVRFLAPNDARNAGQR